MYSFDYEKCLLCYDAPCTKACGKVDIERVMRSLVFENYEYALKMLKNVNCASCSANCESACVAKLDIKKIFVEDLEFQYLLKGVDDFESVDISTDICGVKLENPFILSSSCVGSNYDMISRAFDAGWAGVSYKTISLMEMYEASPRYSAIKNNFNHFFGFKNIEQLSSHSLEKNIDIISELKKNYPNKVVIGSIMGRNESEWEYLAREVSEAGADIIELNFSCPNMEEKNTGSDIGQDPNACYKFTKAAKRGSKVPVIAKLTPNITDIKVPALACIEAGADGIAAINTIKSVTGVDIDTKVALPAIGNKSMIGGYSGKAVKPIALRLISELAKNETINKKHISGMGGITNWRDAIEFLMLGANSLQMTTSVMQYGYRIIDDLVSGLKIYMKQNNYTSLNEIVSCAINSLVENDEINRDSLVYPIFYEKWCLGCGRCHIACFDAGHQAMLFDTVTRKPRVDGSKCVGCMLCSLVCANGAIGMSKRVNKTKN